MIITYNQPNKIVFFGVYGRECGLWVVCDLGVSWQAYDLGEP
jgi:hypothetical protein